MIKHTSTAFHHLIIYLLTLTLVDKCVICSLWVIGNIAKIKPKYIFVLFALFCFMLVVAVVIVILWCVVVKCLFSAYGG